jgi:hypothetical protein
MPSLTLSLALPRPSISGGFAAPGNVTATSSGTANNRTITADWDAPADAPNTYDVEYSYNGGAFTGTQSISHPTTTYDFTGLDDGIYQVRVRAVYASGESIYVVSAEENTGVWFIPVLQPLGVF